MADIKISALGAISSVAGEDLIAIIDDPSGTPASRKATITQVATFVNTNNATASSTTTFTNKTFDADGTGNSITNIENDDIKSGAGIEQSKIADLTTDLGLKAPLASPTFTGTVNGASLILSGDLTVQGTTTTIDSTTINVQNAVVFEGATADAYETTLTVVDPTADRTVSIPNATDTLVGKATTDTLTNKSISLTNNTLTATSLELKTAISDETGSGALVFGTSPTLTTPDIGTPSNGVLTSCTGYKETFIIACSDETTDLETGTGKAEFQMPYAFTITDVMMTLTTAGTGSEVTVDINEGGTTILSTKLTTDASEKTSRTATTPAVISDSALANNAVITIDIDQIGSSVAGTGLKVYIIGYQS